MPFAEISSLTMVPVSHLTWASGWLGLADDGVAIAQALLREDAARHDSLPLGARSRAVAHKDLQALRAPSGSVRELQALFGAPDRDDEPVLAGPRAVLNALKLGAVELAAAVCRQCLQAGGLLAYANNGTHSLGRHLRDALGDRQRPHRRHHGPLAHGPESRLLLMPCAPNTTRRSLR